MAKIRADKECSKCHKLVTRLRGSALCKRCHIRIIKAKAAGIVVVARGNQAANVRLVRDGRVVG